MITAGVILALTAILWFVSRSKKKGSKNLATAIWIIIALSFALYLVWQTQK